MSANPSVIQATPTGLSADAVRALSLRRREPGWLLDLRLQAWSAFEKLPMPTTSTEGWRRTDLRGLRLDTPTTWAEPLAAVGAPRQLPPLVRTALAGDDDVCGILVQEDASTIYRHLAGELERRGVLILDLAQAVHEHEDLVRQHLGTVVAPSEEKFSALHFALMNSGALVYVPRHVAITLPLQLISSYARQHLGAFTHVLVIAESGAEVTLVDEYLSAGRQGQGLASGVVEIVARPNARVRYVQLQQWGTEQWSFSTLRARIERDAAVSWLVIAMGGQLTRANVDSRMAGPGAETHLAGLIFGDGSQHFDHHTLQSHEASRTRSDLLFKAVLRDRARSNYTGMVHIAHTARECDATQESRNMLLSKGAKADADPRLEILNSDVIRASHGASVGPVDEETLYYVMTRGLSRRDAERMLVQAFFEPVLAGVPIESLRKKLWASIEARLVAEVSPAA